MRVTDGGWSARAVLANAGRATVVVAKTVVQVIPGCVITEVTAGRMACRVMRKVVAQAAFRDVTTYVRAGSGRDVLAGSAGVAEGVVSAVWRCLPKSLACVSRCDAVFPVVDST
ncbi:hypothetical protein GTY41_29560 [Streptomyces sp. SID685]|nr:hypothetical protein [Streptomyces sp. SID685]